MLRCRSRPHLAVTSMRVGTRIAVYKAAIGWAYMAGMDEAGREHLLQRVKERVGREWPETARHVMAAMLQHAAQGFVVNRGLLAPGLNSAAVPVRLPGGVHVALNCSGPEDILTLARLNREVGPELMSLADKISKLFPPRPDAV
jgi:DNA-binding IclR family transcriptional regulator